MQSHTPNAQMGFLLGCAGGLALSMGVVGVVVGMNLSGGATFANGAPQAPIAQAPVPPAAPLPPSPPAAPPPAVDPKTDHIRGNVNAKISVIEYSDFECPFCKRHHPTLQQVMAKYGNDVNWVYRHYPLSFHPAAQKAAEASECAAELGGNEMFWKYADALFALPQVTVDQLVPAAKTLGMDEAKFKTCLDSGKFAQKITDQMNAGAAAGVDGTPGNFVVKNGTTESQSLIGAVPYSNFETAIDGMLK